MFSHASDHFEKNTYLTALPMKLDWIFKHLFIEKWCVSGQCTMLHRWHGIAAQITVRFERAQLPHLFCPLTSRVIDQCPADQHNRIPQCTRSIERGWHVRTPFSPQMGARETTWFKLDSTGLSKGEVKLWRKQRKDTKYTPRNTETSEKLQTLIYRHYFRINLNTT